MCVAVDGTTVVLCLGELATAAVAVVGRFLVGDTLDPLVPLVADGMRPRDVEDEKGIPLVDWRAFRCAAAEGVDPLNIA